MKKYFQAPWNIKDLLVVSLISFTLMISSYYLIKLNPIPLGEDFLEKFRIQLVVLVFLGQWLMMGLPLLILTCKKYQLKWEYFGFRKIKIWELTKTVLSGYFFYLAINMVISMIILYNDIKLPGYQLQENIFNIFGTDMVGIITAGIVVILVAPAIEEIIFRGFLLSTLVNKVGIWAGSILTALIFAGIHMPWQSIIPIFILALILNRIYIKTHSIWATITFHIINNGIAFAFSLLIANGTISLDALVISLS